MNVLFLLSISMIRNGSLIVVANHSIQIDQTYYPPGVIMITIVVTADNAHALSVNTIVFITTARFSGLPNTCISNMHLP